MFCMYMDLKVNDSLIPGACPWTMVNAVASISSNGGRANIMLHVHDGR